MWPHPQALEQLLVADRVHALPKAFVPIGGQLAFRREAFEDLGFQAAIGGREAVQNRRFENQEASINPPGVGLRLFAESGDQWAIERQASETSRWANRC